MSVMAGISVAISWPGDSLAGENCRMLFELSGLGPASLQAALFVLIEMLRKFRVVLPFSAEATAVARSGFPKSVILLAMLFQSRANPYMIECWLSAISLLGDLITDNSPYFWSSSLAIMASDSASHWLMIFPPEFRFFSSSSSSSSSLPDALFSLVLYFWKRC